MGSWRLLCLILCLLLGLVVEPGSELGEPVLVGDLGAGGQEELLGQPFRVQPGAVLGQVAFGDGLEPLHL